MKGFIIIIIIIIIIIVIIIIIIIIIIINIIIVVVVIICLAKSFCYSGIKIAFEANKSKCQIYFRLGSISRETENWG